MKTSKFAFFVSIALQITMTSAFAGEANSPDEKVNVDLCLRHFSVSSVDIVAAAKDCNEAGLKVLAENNQALNVSIKSLEKELSAAQQKYNTVRNKFDESNDTILVPISPSLAATLMVLAAGAAVGSISHGAALFEKTRELGDPQSFKAATQRYDRAIARTRALSGVTSVVAVYYLYRYLDSIYNLQQLKVAVKNIPALKSQIDQLKAKALSHESARLLVAGKIEAQGIGSR